MRKSVWSRLLTGLQLVVLLSLVGCSDGSITVTNSPPSAVIEAPSIGTEVLEGASVIFRGAVEDRSTLSADISVTWSSSLDGELMSGNADSEGVTEFSTTELSYGTHTITLQARDADGASGEDTLELLVRADAAPSISIVAPTADGVYYSDLPVTLQVSVNDAEDLPEDLRVSWAVDAGETLASDLEPDSTGLSTTSSTMAAGTYVLIATAIDTAERTATATVTIAVGPPNTAPTCEITSPASLSTAPLGELVVIEGAVADVDVPADWLEASFESNVDGPLGTATPSTAGEVGLATSGLTAATHTITMNVADEVGGTCSHFIFLTVSTPPSATITTPTSGDPLNAGDTLTLSGTVSDVEDADDSLGVAWESDVDGVLGSPSPDSSGAVALNFSLSAGPHLLTLTATDSVGLTGTDTVSVNVNSPPTAPVVSISPGAPTTADNLTVIIDTASTDADGAPSALSYNYAWTRGGNAQGPFSPPETVPAAQTTSNDLWVVTVTATDGQASSAGATAQVTVGNSAPSVASATVAPTLGVNGTTFTVTPSGWSDPDAGDSPGYTYQWVAGSSPIAGEVSAAYTATGLPSGSQIYCEVTPFDGTTSGAMVVSSSAQLNSLPVVAGVNISPSSATESTPLSANYTNTSDADTGQTVTVSWQWNLGGTPITGATTASLTGADFDSGDSITVTVTPNDTLEDGLPVTSTPIVIDNTPPSMTSVNITPTTAYTATTLTANPVGWSDPDPADSTPAYLYEWFAGSNPVGSNSATLAGSEFLKDDVVTVQVTPNDTSSSGSSVLSNPGVTILNTPPTAPGVSISPATPDESQDLVCSVSSLSSDVDPGDNVTYAYSWQESGGASAIGATLPNSATAPGETWTCEVTPNDGTDFGPSNSATVGPITASCAPGDEACPATSCLDLLNSGVTIDGTYWIDPGSTAAFEVYCDMTTDGGGWTLVGMVHPADSVTNVDEEYTWFRDGNNEGPLSDYSPTLNQEPSSFGTARFLNYLAGRPTPVARFHLISQLQPNNSQTWFKGASSSAFEAWFANDTTPTVVCDDPALSSNCSAASSITWPGSSASPLYLGMALTDYGVTNEIHMRCNDVGGGPNSFEGVFSHAPQGHSIWSSSLGHELSIWIQ